MSPLYLVLGVAVRMFSGADGKATDALGENTGVATSTRSVGVETPDIFTLVFFTLST